MSARSGFGGADQERSDGGGWKCKHRLAQSVWRPVTVGLRTRVRVRDKKGNKRWHGQSKGDNRGKNAKVKDKVRRLRA